MPVTPVMSAGGRDPNRLRDLLLNGCCSLCDHPTLRGVDGGPVRGVRITDAGRAALTVPGARRRAPRRPEPPRND